MAQQKNNVNTLLAILFSLLLYLGVYHFFISPLDSESFLLYMAVGIILTFLLEDKLKMDMIPKVMVVTSLTLLTYNLIGMALYNFTISMQTAIFGAIQQAIVAVLVSLMWVKSK